jgi:sec-independent protein translocase protein TatB
MFDIGFSELVVIAIVALIVIGPERLPKVARTMGHLFGRMQRYVNDVKADISREMELDELKKMQSSMEDAARSMRDSVDSVNKEVSAAGGELNKLAQSAQPVADTYPDPPLQEPPPAPVSTQTELPLDSNPPPAQKQA